MGKIAKKSWDTIIEHAKSCEVDDGERYFYQYVTTAQQRICLLFNSIYKLVGVSFDGHNNYRSLEQLNSEEKCLVEMAKRNAYENMETSIYGSMKTSAGQPSASSSLGELIQDEQVGTDDPMVVNNSTCSGDDWELGAAAGLEFANYLSPPLPWGLGNPFDLSYHYFPDLASTSSGRKRKTVWNKIRHALRWVIPFVAKRKAKLSIACN